MHCMRVTADFASFIVCGPTHISLSWACVTALGGSFCGEFEASHGAEASATGSRDWCLLTPRKDGGLVLVCAVCQRVDVLDHGLDVVLVHRFNLVVGIEGVGIRLPPPPQRVLQHPRNYEGKF